MPKQRFDPQRMTDYEEDVQERSADPEVVESVKTTPELDEINWPHEDWEAEAGLENVKTEEEDVEMEDTESMLELQAQTAAEADAEEYDPQQWEQYKEEEEEEEEEEKGE